MTVSNNTETARKAAVYRLYDSAGALLYVGSSYNPVRRCRDHHAKPWWSLVARRDEEWFPSKEAAYAAEMAAIAAEAPPYNEMGTPRYVPPSVKAASRRGPRSGELTVTELLAEHGISRRLLLRDVRTPRRVERGAAAGVRRRRTPRDAWARHRGRSPSLRGGRRP
ncbi:GIY-YIG nuclease family protein [Streptomyces sp. NPDC003877]